MDYHSIHGHDVSSFDRPLKDRVITVSAAQALEELNDKASRFVSTSLAELDLALTSGAADTHAANLAHGGVRKGQVTEVWGPPGIGKTTFGIQLVANAIREGTNAMWVDALHPVCSRRLPATTGAANKAAGGRLVHFTCPTLAHFIALLCRPSTSCITENSGLIVVDSLSALITDAFPRMRDKDTGNKAKQAPSGAVRRNKALRYIATALQKLAATHDVAVVILTQCVTRIERGAALIPAINAGEWDHGVSTRVVLFRDWLWHNNQPLGVRFVGVQKVDGKVAKATETVIPFDIDEKGLVASKLQSSQAPTRSVASQKRKLGDTDFEVPNSEDEDYGWLEEDELPEMPPQWQGSEDILLGHQPGSDQDSEPGDRGFEDGNFEDENEANDN